MQKHDYSIAAEINTFAPLDKHGSVGENLDTFDNDVELSADGRQLREAIQRDLRVLFQRQQELILQVFKEDHPEFVVNKLVEPVRLLMSRMEVKLNELEVCTTGDFPEKGNSIMVVPRRSRTWPLKGTASGTACNYRMSCPDSVIEEEDCGDSSRPPCCDRSSSDILYDDHDMSAKCGNAQNKQTRGSMESTLFSPEAGKHVSRIDNKVTICETDSKVKKRHHHTHTVKSGTACVNEMNMRVMDKILELDKLCDESSRGMKSKDMITRQFLIWMDLWMNLEEPPRTGPLSQFVTGPIFEFVCSLVIILNAIFMYYATDYGIINLHEERTSFMTVAERLFLGYFSVEMILRVQVHKLWYFANKDMKWNIFDFLLVFIALYDEVSSAILADGGFDTNVTFMRSMRVIKMVKTLRVIRLMQCISELRRMLNSVMGCFMSLFWSFLMMVFIFYLFGLAMVQGITNDLLSLKPEELDQPWIVELMDHFGSVGLAMLTCYKATTGGDDWAKFFDIFKKTGTMNIVLFLFFICFSHIALMNILTGIFVENAMKLAQPEYNALAMDRRRKNVLEAQQLRTLFEGMDSDRSGKLTKEEFKEKMEEEQVKAYLSVMGLEIKDTEAFFNMLAGANDGEVDIDFFIDACKKMKGQASSIDVHSLSFETKIMQRRQDEFRQGIDSMFRGIMESLRVVQASTVDLSSDLNSGSRDSAGQLSIRGLAGNDVGQLTWPDESLISLQLRETDALVSHNLQADHDLQQSKDCKGSSSPGCIQALMPSSLCCAAGIPIKTTNISRAAGPSTAKPSWRNTLDEEERCSKPKPSTDDHLPCVDTREEKQLSASVGGRLETLHLGDPKLRI